MTEDKENHWTLYAACRGKWGLFDSVEDENGNDTYPFIKEARALCDTCPVFDYCDIAGARAETNIWAGEPKGR